MDRTVLLDSETSVQVQGKSDEKGIQGYVSRVAKMAPAESVAAYLTLDGFIRGQDAAKVNVSLLLWLVFGALTVLTVPYLRTVARVRKRQQVFISTAAFVAWVLAIGGPFTSTGWYQPVYGGIAVVLFAFVVPLFPKAVGRIG